MNRFLRVAAILLVLSSGGLLAGPLLLDGFEDLQGWETGGQKEISLSQSEHHVIEGKHSLHLHVAIDHEKGESIKKVKYPMGWPSVRKTYDPSIDLSTYDFLEMDLLFYKNNQNLALYHFLFLAEYLQKILLQNQYTNYLVLKDLHLNSFYILL